MRPYEEFLIEDGRIVGKTFGCNCCVHDDPLEDSSVVSEMTKTAEMYERMAGRYRAMADEIAFHGVVEVSKSIDRCKMADCAWSDLDSALRHIAGENMGTHGGDMASIGIDRLKQVFNYDRSKISHHDIRLYELFVGYTPDWWKED